MTDWHDNLAQGTREELIELFREEIKDLADNLLIEILESIQIQLSEIENSYRHPGRSVVDADYGEAEDVEWEEFADGDENKQSKPRADVPNGKRGHRSLYLREHILNVLTVNTEMYIYDIVYLVLIDGYSTVSKDLEPHVRAALSQLINEGTSEQVVICEACRFCVVRFANDQ